MLKEITNLDRHPFRRFRIAVASLVLLWSSVGFAQAGGDATFEGRNFVVKVPQAIHVNKETKEDFDLYYFFQTNAPEGKKVLRVYTGNHPASPDNLPANIIVRILTLGRLKAKSVEWIDDRGRFCRSVLVDVREWFPRSPQYVQLAYNSLSAEEKSMADKIIESIKVLESGRQ